jgi:hypothetical protein
MKLTDLERKLVETSLKLESRKCREDLMFQCEAMVRAQDALKADYGLAGLDAPLFNGTGGAADGSAA